MAGGTPDHGRGRHGINNHKLSGIRKDERNNHHFKGSGQRYRHGHCADPADFGRFYVLTNFVAARLGVMQDDKENIARILRENAAIRTELAEIKDLLERHGE